MVANRMVLLDHLTRGRVMLGVGPGALASDAYMFCINPERQREMMDESLGVIMQLLDGSVPRPKWQWATSGRMPSSTATARACR